MIFWIEATRFLRRRPGTSGEITREIQYQELSPILGYTSAIYGQTGIEAAMYPYLRGLEGYPESTILLRDLLYNQPPEGLNIRLTLDLFNQQIADDALGDSSGSAILMNAETGEILAMASHPYFNPATLDEDWEMLTGDENAPLINRATQGEYPVGTALFPFVMTTPNDRNHPPY